MEDNGLKKRNSQIISDPLPDLAAEVSGSTKEPHPAGEVKHGGAVQLLRMILFATWFFSCLTSIHFTQLLGLPLYIINKDYFYAYMALTKQSFGLVVTTITQWFSPTLVRVSGDASMRGQMRMNSNGQLQTMFPERLVMIANHQLYTDWLYLWWIAYTSRMHGHIYIILKESLKYIPFIGPGMMLYGFIFMSRKWTSDKPRLKHRLDKLKSRHGGPMAGSATLSLDPMWLLIYPEGTNLSANTRDSSAKWANTKGIQDLRHTLLPRSTGLFFCLQQLEGTIDWIYDCTVAYEGTPKGGYAQDIFTLRSTYFQGRPPKSVNMYWQRFALADIPLKDSNEFEDWLSKRWREKDELLEQFKETGRFPRDIGISESDKTGTGYIDTEVRLANWYEIGGLFVVLATFGLTCRVIVQLWRMFS